MSTLVVPDASVVIKWYLPEPMADEALAWLEGAARHQLGLVAPDLLLYEVANVMWRHVRSGSLSPKDAHSIVTHVTNSPVQMIDATVVIADALRYASLCDITVYDASYIALACALDTRVVTADERLVRALSSTPLEGRAVNLKTAAK